MGNSESRYHSQGKYEVVRKYLIALLIIFLLSSYAFAGETRKPSKTAGEVIKETGIAIGAAGKDVGMMISRDVRKFAHETGKFFKETGTAIKNKVMGKQGKKKK